MVSRTAALALLAVACLVLAGSAPSAGTIPRDDAWMQPGTEPAFSDWVLTLDGQPERTSVGTVGLDVAQSVEDQRSATTIQLQRHALTRRLDGATSDEERFEILTNELQSIDVRLSGLYDAEQEALSAYLAGDLSVEGYLKQTAFIDARVDQYMNTVSMIETEGERIQASAISRSVEGLRTEAAVIGGPLQQRIASVYRGGAAPLTVRVEGGTTGYVAVAMVDDRVVRQSHLYGLRAEEGATQDLRTSLDHVYTQYPDETSESPAIEVGGQRSSGVFYVTITTTSGVTFTSYVDNRNLSVFKEVYREPPSQLTVTDTTGQRGEGIDLFVDRVPSYGVLGIQTNDVDSGNTIDAQVFVDGIRVGTTGPDGRLWVVDRPGETNVTATDGPNRSVSITVPA